MRTQPSLPLQTLTFPENPSPFNETRTSPDKPYQTGGTNEVIDFTPVISDKYKKIIQSTVINQPSQTPDFN